LLLGCILMAGPAMLSASPQASQAPLSKEQVLGLVRNQLGDETGARAIRERGIDFEPTEDFLGALKSVGASDAFIAAIEAAFEAWKTTRHPAAEQPGTHPQAPATHPQAPATPPIAPTPGAPPAAQTPLDFEQILDLMINKIPSPRMAALVKERGIDFHADEGTLSLFESLGAKDDLLKALRSAKMLSQGWQVDRATEKIHAQLAEADYTEKLQRDPKNHIVRTALFFARSTQGKKDGGVELFREGVRLEPNDAWSHTMLAMALGVDNREEAGQELRKAIRLQPNFYLAHEFLAGLLETEKDWKPAIVEFREVARLKPDWADPHVHIGKILSENLEDHDGAIHEYQQATRLDSNNDDVFWNLGEQLMYWKDNPAEAIAPFRTACELDPDNYTYHHSLGNALVKQGDKAAGWEEYRKAHDLKPDDQGIRAKFEALSKELGK